MHCIHSKPILLLTFLLVLSGLVVPASWAETAPSPEKALETGHFELESLRVLPAAQSTSVKKRPLTTPDALPGFVRVRDGRAEKMTTLLSSGFEGSFPGADWSLLALGQSDVTWGRSTQRASTGAASVWCAQSGSDAPGPGSDVPVNTQSWMIAGPFDLSSTTSGELAFDLWLETESGFDFFFAAASTDGSNFTALGTDQSTTGWDRFALDLTQWGALGNLTGRSAVWFAFLYESDSSVTREGAYVDEVRLTTDLGMGGGGLNLIINQIDAGSCPQVDAIVSVLDDQGNPVAGLTEANFSLEEDGIQETFTVDTPSGGGSSLAVSLVLDSSGSLSNSDVVNIKAASNAFIDLLAPNDRVAVYDFDSNVLLLQDYTTNHNAAHTAVNTLDNSGFTALFDAIVEAANHSLTVGGRKALIVMTDGEDTASSADQQQAIAAAQAAGVPVFTIGFGNANDQVLEDIANATGGIFFDGATSADLQTIFNLIGQTLNSQFILSWNTAVRDGGVHNISVRVDFGGQSVSRTATYSQAGTPCANGGGACVDGPTTLCLSQERFRVQVEWIDLMGNRGPASVAACGSDDSGLLWFFDPNNWEMLIKIVNGCGFNNRYWVFFAATTNLGYNLRVTDTDTGAVKVYTNSPGSPAPAVTDTLAFATCP